MRRRVLSLVPALFLVVIAAPSLRAAGDARVTVDNAAGSYTRYDGSTDATMQACSTGRRQQNEPAVAVDPSSTNVVVAGANDYCATIVNPDVWAGFYRSIDGGAHWSNSLVPGYPQDASAGGLASPVHGTCAASGDPTQSFDTSGNLFYGFICFNRTKPVNGGVYVATYSNHGSQYERTVLVKRGTPSGLFLAGLFQDKINLTVDQSGGSNDGNIYVAWSQYNAFAPGNAVLFSRSTDSGHSFSTPIKVTPKEHGTASFADLAVGPDGTIWLTYITYASSSRPTTDIWLVSSADAGASWSSPMRVASISRFDSDLFTGGTGGADCGDGPFACPSGFTFSRFFSNSAVAADAAGAHVVWAGRLASGQSKVHVRTWNPTTSTWGSAQTLDTFPAGHQWFPDIGSADGKLTVIFYDSRNDPAYAGSRPPGNTAAGVNSGDVVEARIATSTDGGTAWSESVVSAARSNFGWETQGARRIGFWGDYLYVSSVPGAVHVAWTDSRDLVPGSDPRETGADDDHDGFDVFQPCTYVPNDINAPAYSSPTISDPCLSQGGLDENIYGARV
jgi:hypothetical protein